MVRDAITIKDRGFEVIKVKLGGDPDEDIFRIKAMRAAVGDALPFRLDANQGWDAGNALRVLNALADCNIQFCEEPIPRWNYMELPKLSSESRVKIMADESCCDHHDAERLIRLNAAPMFNIKLGKSSGIFKAQKIIKLAESANLQLQIGGFLESRIGFTASAHLALTSSAVVYCDFDSPMMFEENPVSGGIEYEAGGRIRMPEVPGLGAEIDSGYLQKLNGFIIR